METEKVTSLVLPEQVTATAESERHRLEFLTETRARWLFTAGGKKKILPFYETEIRESDSQRCPRYPTLRRKLLNAHLTPPERKTRLMIVTANGYRARCAL